MNRWIINYVKQYAVIVWLYSVYKRVKHWLMDIRSAILSKDVDAKMTPFGFCLAGTDSIHHIAMQNGTFEPEEVAIFQEAFTKADIFVDVGANIGFYACLARKAGLQVLAIEPLEKNLILLEKNITENFSEGVEILPVGISDRQGTATLYGGSSTGASLVGKWAGSSSLFQQTIVLSTLDNIVGDDYSGQNIFIKIDVEGAEYQALLGASTVLMLNPKPVWLIEVCFNEYHPDGMNPNYRGTFEIFWKNGYEVRTADIRNNLILPSDVDEWLNKGVCESGTINYMFTHKAV